MMLRPGPPTRRSSGRLARSLATTAATAALALCLGFLAGRASVPRRLAASEGAAAPHPPPPGGGGSPTARLVVGVQTGYVPPPGRRADPKYDYAARRAALRASWFPDSPAGLARLEAGLGVAARFVVGEPGPGAAAAAAAAAALDAEAARHGGFLRLRGVQESYEGLPNKTAAFFAAALALFPAARFVVKADDDVFVQPARLAAAAAQWRADGADYVGCMKAGAVQADPRVRWHEPHAALLPGGEYFAHAWGSAYALSRAGAAALAAPPPPPPALGRRAWANEDVAVGAAMLFHGAAFLDDRRLCAPACSAASVAVWDMPRCPGLCAPAQQLRAMAADPACAGEVAAGEALARAPPLLDLLPPRRAAAAGGGEEERGV